MPDLLNDTINGAKFEEAVRHVARQLYQNARASGSIILDGRERDDIIDTGTELIIIEATQLRTVKKIEGDLKKSILLVSLLREKPEFSDYNFRILLVTSHDPTADQAKYVKETKAGCPKEIISFSSLFSRLFDSRHYIRLRGDHFFGSIRDPANESNFNVPASEYIPTSLSNSRTGESLHARNLFENIANGGRYIILGDYGSGKSMTLRDLYFRARDKFSSGESIFCPVYLNLREHVAQSQPDEALYRHAEKIGFKDPHSLISAWRAGFVTLFLDGFDELTPPQFASSIVNLKQARRFAVEVVFRFLEQTPQVAPIVIAGRESYFDTREECRQALGYNEEAQVFDLAGFTDKDIERYLKIKKNIIPAWMPTRPLLVGYLANSGILLDQEQLLSMSPIQGWDRLLQRVCEREVKQIWGVGFEAQDLRLFIERLATKARASNSGRGLDDSSLKATFRSIFGRDADEPANLLTLRLPGLGAVPGRSGEREFIDADFADAAAGGDQRRFIESPHIEPEHLREARNLLGSLAREISIFGISDPDKKISFALSNVSSFSNYDILIEDLLQTLADLGLPYVGPKITISDKHFDCMFVPTTINSSRIAFRHCTINILQLPDNLNMETLLPCFVGCMIERVDGATSINDVPPGTFVEDTSVTKFTTNLETNDAVMSSGLPDSTKVLITILRKLFLQRGSGRQYGALKRGLPPKLVRYVDPITDLIKTNSFAGDVHIDRRKILVPNRALSAEALSIINGPNISNSSLAVQVRSLR